MTTISTNQTGAAGLNAAEPAAVGGMGGTGIYLSGTYLITAVIAGGSGGSGGVPRVEEGYELEAVRRRLLIRAEILLESTGAPYSRGRRPSVMESRPGL